MYLKQENDVKINKNCQNAQNNLQCVTTTSAEAIQSDMMIDRKLTPKSKLKSTTEQMQANLSTTSTDSGAIIIDNNKQIFPNKCKRKGTQFHDNNLYGCDVENVKNLADNIEINNIHDKQQKLEQSASPAASLRSLSISIVSIDANARDSSVVDSDFETELEGEKYVIHKLGEQTTFAPDSADVPRLHNGLKVVSQLVSPGPEFPLQSEMCTNKSTGPSHIGSIALSNSTDVTFGDKHFYEGPVTIQQFLIDSTNKQKEKAAYNNKAYESDNAKSFPNTATMKNISLTDDVNNMCSCLGLQVSRRAIYFITVIIAVLTMATVLFYILSVSNLTSTSKQWGEGDDTRLIYPNITNLDKDNIGDVLVLRMVWRYVWLAQPPTRPLIKHNLPVSMVIVMPTQTEICLTRPACISRVRLLQMYNIESEGYDDIKYNFLIGGDGAAYEGRGWDHKGAHMKGFNDNSISLAFIGTFLNQRPNARQLNLTNLLLEDGIRQGKLQKDYKMIPASALDPTSSIASATALYASFENWTHWMPHLNGQ